MERAIPAFTSQLQSITPVQLRLGGWVRLGGWLHTEILYLWTVIHLSTNLAEHKLTSLMHVYDVYYLYYYAKPPRDKMYTFQHFNRLTALCPGLPGWAGTRKVIQSGFYWSKRQWVAVASTGPYASMHLALDRYQCQHRPYSIFYRPDALPATQPPASKHWRHTSQLSLKRW